MKTFEQRIEESFIKYGRIPLLVTLIMVFLTFMGYYIYTSIIEVNNTQKQLIQEISAVENGIDHTFQFDLSKTSIMDMTQNIESYSQDFYQKYYQLNSQFYGNIQLIVYGDTETPLLITQPSLAGNSYMKYYNRILLERLDHVDTLSSAVTNLESEATPKVVYGRKYRDQEGSVLKILYFVDSEIYRDMLQTHRNNQLVLTDGFDNVIVSTSRDFVTKSQKFVTHSARSLDLDHTSYHVSSRSFGDDAMKIHVLVQKNSLASTFVIVALIVAVALFIVDRINKYSARKIGREASSSIAILIAAVDEMKHGNIEIHVDLKTGDEFELLADAFNDMGTQLSALISSNEKLLELRKDAEIKQLEAQFNPHFLYNSLETIRYLIVDDPKVAERLILNTTKLLRYSITPGENEVLFREDIEYIKLYLEVNKMRLQERFMYTIDIEEDVMNAFLPKLLIQPLIENCLKHGYRYKDSLTIGVFGYSNDNYIFIHVVDDGGGMHPATVTRIKNTRGNDTSGGYGITSVMQRIELMYGSKGNVNIESDTEGTHIFITIPKGGKDNV